MLKNLFVVLTTALSFGAACASQPEGGRCDRNNNDDDCETGLVCTLSSQLASNPAQSVKNGQTSTLGLCCPPSGSTQYSTPACIPNTGTTGTGGASGSGGTDAGVAGDSGSAAGGAGTGGAGTGGAGTAGAGSGGTAGSGTGGTAGATAHDASSDAPSEAGG